MIKKSNLPIHVAIIPDGNRRWAKEHNLPMFEGHRRGYIVANKITKHAHKMGIPILTYWAFSTENWFRIKEEVGCLMKLFEKGINQHLKEALVDQVRIIHIGRKDHISSSLRTKIEEAEKKTKHFDKKYLVIALDYGGRDEIDRVINRIMNYELRIKNNESKMQNFPLRPSDFEGRAEFRIKNLEIGRQKTEIRNQKTEINNLNQYLDTKDLPQQEPDLIIRTGGEKRTSGFMLWQSEYSEYEFIDKLFPDFTIDDFEKAIKDYQERKRRFGK